MGQLGEFGDARRAASGDALLERVMTTGSLVVRTLGRGRAGEIRIHRFLDAPSVTAEEMVETLSSRTAAACAGRRIVAAQDTTEINFSGREAKRKGLGPAGDGASAGFFIHPVIAVDAEDEAVLGLVDAQIWTRDAEASTAPRRGRTLADKESRRWLTAAERTAERLKDAASVVVVGDRESDVYAVFARRPASVDLLVRAAQDRALESGGKLFAAAEAWPELTRMEVAVSSKRIGDPGRTATVAVRAGRVSIRRPQSGFEKCDPETLSLTYVEVREVDAPAVGEPLLWRLLTSLDAVDAAGVIDVVRLYRLRWRIEEVFRALKSDGLRLEDVQFADAAKLFKLAAIGMAAATRTLQLVDARDGGARPATDVVDPDVLPAAHAIAPTLEGKTARQKNPHAPNSLAWLAWIIARLGGWNCYYKPPGPKTMRAGWNRFAMMVAGFHLAQQKL